MNALLAGERSENRHTFQRDLRQVRLQLLLEPDRDAAEQGGSYETYSSGEARWSAEIEETDVIDLFRVELSIAFPTDESSDTEGYSESLYLLRPTWTDELDRSDLLAKRADAIRERRDEISF